MNTKQQPDEYARLSEIAAAKEDGYALGLADARSLPEREAQQPVETPVSRDLVAKIRAAQFRFFEKKGVEFSGADLMCREEAQFIAREISPIERESVTLSDDDKREIVNLMVSRAEAMGDISMFRNMGAALSAILSDPRFELRRRT